MVKYVYDAWGNHKGILAEGTKIYDSATGAVTGYENHIGNVNPFRYRGYYYDVATGLYYLQSRYYDPQVGRFLIADDINILVPLSITINGLNLYAYCLNNPILYVDYTGKIPVANVVYKTHYEKSFKLINNYVLGKIFGNLKLTASYSKQDKETGFFYAYSDHGVDGINLKASYAAGINAWGWFGFATGINSEGNLIANVNLTPWFYVNSQLGLDGIGLSVGINVDNASYDLSITIGWGTIGAIVIAVAAAPYLAPLVAAIGLLISIF